jgi:hypothetical protein
MLTYLGKNKYLNTEHMFSNSKVYFLCYLCLIISTFSLYLFFTHSTIIMINNGLQIKQIVCAFLIHLVLNPHHYLFMDKRVLLCNHVHYSLDVLKIQEKYLLINPIHYSIAFKSIILKVINIGEHAFDTVH